MILIIQRQKLDLRKQTGYVNDSIKRSFRNSIRSRSEKSSIFLFLNYKKTWMNGSNIITMKEHIRVRYVVEEPQLKLSRMKSNIGKKSL